MNAPNVLAVAFTFFLVANPVGNSPAIIALIKDFDFDLQKKIVLRESFFSFLLAIFFQYFGEVFLQLLEISNTTVSLCGGILLLLVALNMIFTPSQGDVSNRPVHQQPFLVPIATPLISGPALLTIIMLYSRKLESNLLVTLAIVLAWLGITGVLVASPYLQRILKKRGLAALEQLMGLLLAMMAVEMTMQGISKFISGME